MKDTARALHFPLPGWLLTVLFVPVAAMVGFSSASSTGLLAGGLAAMICVVLFALVRLAVPVKLMFLLITVSFLQRLIGYFRAGDVRGLNVGNLFLMITIGYWFFNGLRERRLYRPTSLDLWLFVTTIAFPLTSILMTAASQRVEGYELNPQLTWYKQWITPFIYFFLLCQCLERKKDVRLLCYLALGLVGLAVLQGMPEALRFSNWRQSRSEGIVGQANDYASLLATVAPYLFLFVFIAEKRPAARLLALGLLGCMAVAMITTYSRAGYIGFFVAFLGALYVAYRSMGQLTVLGPAIVLAALCLVPVIAVPQIMESLETRFAAKTYMRAQRKSYSQSAEINEYSGGRIEIWKCALRMAEDHPLLGVGFHAFERVLPKYHYRQWSNYPHNQFLGALAEGGIVFLICLCVLYWKLWRLLYQNWKVVFRKHDRGGEILCGGALLSFLCMIVMSLANDFMNPGIKNTIFWVLVAGAIRYAMLSREEEEAAATA